MQPFPLTLTRRQFLLRSAAISLGLALPGMLAAALKRGLVTKMTTKPIPATGEAVPVIGMGTWQTFDVGSNPRLRQDCVEVLKTFFRLGGGMVDSSPMYGTAEAVLGHCLEKLGDQEGLFSATKVWTPLAWYGKKQIKASHKLWGLERFDLFQVHNLLSHEKHLERLFEMKKEGKLRYVGVTTSHGRRHTEMEKVMKAWPLDFVQLTYNIEDREAEKRLLPLAKEKGLAVIANRPYQGGNLIRSVKASKRALPGWAVEAGMKNWAEFLLKFVVSHPAVTCAIPATSQVEHMRENMGAGRRPFPDAGLRKRMADYWRNA